MRVRLFDREPDLLVGLNDRVADCLRRQTTVRLLRVDDGAWTPPAQPDPDALGLLVVGGMLVRCTDLDGHQYPELVGAGDLLRPWDRCGDPLSLAPSTSWRVLERADLAVLDGPFAAVACRFPTIVSSLLSRALERSRALSLRLAIAQTRRAEDRLLRLLWHLADRWGHVSASGVLVPLPLTHELLAHMTCLRRPSATTALQRLQNSGEVRRLASGSWLLCGSPPESAAPAA